MKRRISFLLLALLLISIATEAQLRETVQKETFHYATKDSEKLYLDKYALPSSIRDTKPCILFVFGGGFVSGQRDSENYTSYFNQLAERGYTVVSIDYRLGMKNMKADKSLNPMRFLSVFTQTISMSVEDLFDATNFVLDHANEWNIDKKQIIATGSSAGAIAVLQGEYNIAGETELAKKLPEGFNYAGVVSFAGAIFSDQGGVWKNAPCPIQLFHGDADSNVPYDKVEVMNFGLYGSKHISEQLAAANVPYYFYSVENAAHEISNTPMHDNINEICTFIEKFAIKKNALSVDVKAKEIGKEDVDKDFELMDYIGANFGL